MGNIGIWQLAILLAIVVLVFGTKRLRNMGSDMGSAIRGFRKGLSDDEEDSTSSDSTPGQLNSSADDADSQTSSTRPRQSSDSKNS